MHKLQVTMTFQTHNRAQAKFIVKQLRKVRTLASKLGMTHTSKMSTLISKIEN